MSYTHTQIPAELIPYLWNIYMKKYKSTNNTFTNIRFAPPLRFDNDIQELLKKSKYIMEMYGYKFDPNIDPDDVDWLVEFHHYKINQYYESEFARHCDDQAGVSTNVNTILFYLTKDKTIKGGDLIVDDCGIDKKLEIKSGDMIIMSGNLEHEIEPMDGNGERISIVVQIQRE